MSWLAGWCCVTVNRWVVDCLYCPSKKCYQVSNWVFLSCQHAWPLPSQSSVSTLLILTLCVNITLYFWVRLSGVLNGVVLLVIIEREQRLHDPPRPPPPLCGCKTPQPVTQSLTSDFETGWHQQHDAQCLFSFLSAEAHCCHPTPCVHVCACVCVWICFPRVPCKWWLPALVLDRIFCLLRPGVWEILQMFSWCTELQMKPNFLLDLILQFTQQGEAKQNCQNMRQYKHSQTDMLKHVCPHSLTLSQSQQPGFHTQNHNAR